MNLERECNEEMIYGVGGRYGWRRWDYRRLFTLFTCVLMVIGASNEVHDSTFRPVI